MGIHCIIIHVFYPDGENDVKKVHDFSLEPADYQEKSFAELAYMVMHGLSTRYPMPDGVRPMKPGDQVVTYLWDMYTDDVMYRSELCGVVGWSLLDAGMMKKEDML